MDYAQSTRAKLERAKHHIGNLQLLREAFLKSRAYTTIGYDDPETGDRVVKAKITSHPPVQFFAVLGDAIHNLRASLDYLTWSLVQANGGIPDDKTAFPIFPDRETFEAQFSRKIKGASQKALDLIASYKPYKGGNDLLWALHRLDIIGKHRLLISVAACAPMITVPNGYAGLEGFPLNARGNRVVRYEGIVEDGAELYRLPRKLRAQYYQDPHFGFEIAFGDVVKGQFIFFILFKFQKLIAEIIDNFSPLLISDDPACHVNQF